MYINQVLFERKHIVLLTTLHGTLCAFNLTDEVVVGQVKLLSAVNCLGSVRRSSGFRLGTTLLQIGNLNTAALSDSKCVLYAVNLPCLLR